MPFEAWTDLFATWRRDFLAKRQAGMDVKLEIEEGRSLLATMKPRDAAQTKLIREIWRTSTSADEAGPLLSEELAAAATKSLQDDLTRSANYPLVADRPIARAGAWYEMMPRSQASIPQPPRHIRRLYRSVA
jgi:starch synthase (maltosyl-transferring)